MKRILFFSFLLLFVISACSKGANERALKKKNLPFLKKQENCNLELYMCQGRMNNRASFFLKKNDLHSVFLIVGSSIHKKGEVKVDYQKLGKEIDILIPNKNAKGIAVLDWEDKALMALENDAPKSKTFQKASSEFIKAIKFAKKKRPNIKWGFYSLPIKNYWSRNDAWRNQNKELLPILKEVDILFPSIYDFYEDSSPKANREMDSLYVNDNIKEALKIGRKINKPVMPFIWHRYHNSNKEKGYCLIPWNEFESHIQAAIKTKYRNEQIEGLVWWGADSYFYRQKKKALVREARASKNFDAYHNKIIINYTEKIYGLIDEACKEGEE